MKTPTPRLWRWIIVSTILTLFVPSFQPRAASQTPKVQGQYVGDSPPQNLKSDSFYLEYLAGQTNRQPTANVVDVEATAVVPAGPEASEVGTNVATESLFIDSEVMQCGCNMQSYTIRSAPIANADINLGSPTRYLTLAVGFNRA